jgi:xanthine dehydrogenase FAD-binding subunit
MQNSEHTIFFAKTIQDLFYQIKSVSGLRIVGGCTAIDTLPEKAISVRGIPELTIIDKHERYIDFGPAATLSDILALGSNRAPDIFLEAIKSIANPMVRNIATIGGNICMNGHKLTLYAPLLALDSRLELRDPLETKYISLLNFREIPAGSILTNIRIPLNEWAVSVFRRLGPEHQITPASAGFVFLADSQKSIIINIKIAFAGAVTFRAIELENRMIGTRLPLQEKDISVFMNAAARQFDWAAANHTYHPMMRVQFLNLMHYSFEQLT